MSPIFFPNHTGNISILKHKSLPLVMTGEFDFYRCIQFSDNLYGKTVSELHAGNLRLSRSDNRYSNLFRARGYPIGQIVLKLLVQRPNGGEQIITS